MRVVHLGVSSPVADVLFDTAKRALEEVLRSNRRLFEQPDVPRFFYSVRPGYKPYRVGRQEYRGANAGDFSGINEIDLLLGLCRASDAYYAQLLVDKMLFMLPMDQERLRDCMTRVSLIDELLTLAPEHSEKEWFQKNAAALPRALRSVRADRHSASQSARRALHRTARGAASRRKPRRHHGQRPTATGATACAGDPAKTCALPRTGTTSRPAMRICNDCAATSKRPDQLVAASSSIAAIARADDAAAAPLTIHLCRDGRAVIKKHHLLGELLRVARTGLTGKLRKQIAQPPRDSSQTVLMLLPAFTSALARRNAQPRYFVSLNSSPDTSKIASNLSRGSAWRSMPA